MASLAKLLLSRLKGVRPAGTDQWYAHCPAHDDHVPSLSIRDAGDRILTHCFAGCDPEAVLEAVGLQWRDLYPEPWTCARQRPHEAAWRYAQRTLAFPQTDEGLLRRQQALPLPAPHVDGEVVGSRVSREPAPLASATDTAHARLPFVFLSKSCGKFGFPSRAWGEFKPPPGGSPYHARCPALDQATGTA